MGASTRWIALAGMTMALLAGASPAGAQQGPYPPGPPPPPSAGQVSPPATPAPSVSPPTSPSIAPTPAESPSSGETVKPRVIDRDQAGPAETQQGPLVLPFTGAQLALFTFLGLSSASLGLVLTRLGRARPQNDEDE